MGNSVSQYWGNEPAERVRYMKSPDLDPETSQVRVQAWRLARFLLHVALAICAYERGCQIWCATRRLRASRYKTSVHSHRCRAGSAALQHLRTGTCAAACLNEHNAGYAHVRSVVECRVCACAQRGGVPSDCRTYTSHSCCWCTCRHSASITVT